MPTVNDMPLKQALASPRTSNPSIVGKGRPESSFAEGVGNDDSSATAPPAAKTVEVGTTMLGCATTMAVPSGAGEVGSGVAPSIVGSGATEADTSGEGVCPDEGSRVGKISGVGEPVGVAEMSGVGDPVAVGD
jgi:hypothetical protein